MPFRQLELVTVRITDPRAEAHPVGPLLEWANESYAFLFKDGTELPKITGVDANVNICRCHLSWRSLTSVLNQFEERRARFIALPDQTDCHLPSFARVPLLRLPSTRACLA